MTEFYMLNRSKSKRAVLFKNERGAIDFIKQKFHGRNKILHTLIKLGLLQPFLKKVNIESNLGNSLDVIFVANQIKCFDLGRKEVLSLPLKGTEERFIAEKSFQKKLGEYGMAPMVLLDEKLVYSKEKLMNQYNGDIGKAFIRLADFYCKTKIYHQDIIRCDGEIVREHILEDNGSCKFIDWGMPQ